MVLRLFQNASQKVEQPVERAHRLEDLHAVFGADFGVVLGTNLHCHLHVLAVMSHHVLKDHNALFRGQFPDIAHDPFEVEHMHI